jgi:hypothetical protein
MTTVAIFSYNNHPLRAGGLAEEDEEEGVQIFIYQILVENISLAARFVQ